MDSNPLIINDVTGLNPVAVWAIVKPASVAEVQEAVRRASGPISIGGGRFSMGGQTASPGSLHVDMRGMNRIVAFWPMERRIRVQAGIRWCDIQKFVDPHDLSVKIMQSYANFTVGGSLGVNVHGRYMGLGPLILSVRAISLVLANGERVEASPSENSELFYGVIGGYGGLGIVVEAELELAPNVRMERVSQKMPVGDYLAHFRKSVRNSSDAIYHNADIYPPHYGSVRSVTWRETDKPVTEPRRLMPAKPDYPLEKYFLWAMTETPWGKWRREFLIDPLLFATGKVCWRNFEAGYNVAELEPASRRFSTYVLQEYFVPYERFDEFVAKMAEILRRHRVNMLNISVRHAVADPGSLMAWARQECFAFVLYYKQRTRANARHRVAVWTRELIEAAIALGGSHYLPYQAHATSEQFHRAYPRAHELFALKRRLDPDFRFRNVIWDQYYAPTLAPQEDRPMATNSEFHTVYNDTAGHDGFYRFLQNVYRLYPEDRFHTLIKDAVGRHGDDESIYRDLQTRLPGIKPFLADLFYALPSLKKQKQEMTRQTLAILGTRRKFDGYVEIGTTGRYVKSLRKALDLSGPVHLVNDVAPGNSPVDLIERGQLGQAGAFTMMDYRAIPASAVPDASADLVTCYIGLHHCPPDTLEEFAASIARMLRPSGVFILRDHEVDSPQMNAFVSLAHTVFNAGLGVPWETNQAELRFFAPLQRWIDLLARHGLRDSGQRLLQANDPSINTLLMFTKD
ncbi:FAD-binding protein [Arenimonas oryziterrae]|uniref:FAD-binding PCMH-type domain-containing protein n=1 Tax=Arenimonas oryziterrae DSM 21050 = YC6267 TaxID=1121015 RepID=A0A091AW66_9GAMM|nr:FAD-binding protein [Arenimonas oryziterrae]KFN44528.1 hypothetical protein N789_00545 [Arenimonas oryziterrae DSM 21050 = YC6267]